MLTTKNLKDILQQLHTIESVEGILVVDSEGLVLESTFSNGYDAEQLGSVYAIIDLNVRGQLNGLNENPSQIFFNTSDKLIILQKIQDVSLIIYTRKSELAFLQEMLEKVCNDVLKFLNISSSNS